MRVQVYESCNWPKWAMCAVSGCIQRRHCKRRRAADPLRVVQLCGHQPTRAAAADSISFTAQPLHNLVHVELVRLPRWPVT